MLTKYKTKIILFIFIVFLTMNYKIGHSQNFLLSTDTIVNSDTFKIVKRFKSGNIKLIGQFWNKSKGHIMINKKFWPDSLYKLPIKNGIFIKYNRNGREIKRMKYFFDEKWYKKIFWLKHGMWCEDPYLTIHYFFGIATSITHATPDF